MIRSPGQHVQPGALLLDHTGDAERVGGDADTGERAPVGVPDLDGLHRADPLGGDRDPLGHRDAGQVAGVVGVGQPRHVGPPAFCSQGGTGVVQGGATAQRREPTVRINGAQQPAVLRQ
jgi:hypothetical protein